MSFDPQNPRGAPRPTPPPATPSSSPGYVPLQPLGSGGPTNRRLSPVALAVVAIVAIGILALILFALMNSSSPTKTPAPTHSAQTSSTRPSSTPSRTSTTKTPTTTASASAAASASAGPTASLASSVAPAPGYDEFLLHVPESIRATCAAGTLDPPDPTTLFNTRCTAADGIVVAYTQYATADDMNAVYQDVFTRTQIDAESGSCEDQQTWPAESSYAVEGQLAGRRLCTDDPTPSILWTYDALSILSQATTESTDAAALIEFWTTEAGPLP